MEILLEISTIDKIIRWLVILATPIMLTVGTVRFLIAWDNPSYPEFEYARIAPDDGWPRRGRYLGAYLMRPWNLHELATCR